MERRTKDVGEKAKVFESVLSKCSQRSNGENAAMEMVVDEREKAKSSNNGGPGGLTVTNVAPWVTTVGAGTIDRYFTASHEHGCQWQEMWWWRVQLPWGENNENGGGEETTPFPVSILPWAQIPSVTFILPTGLFDSSYEPEDLRKEIVKCIDLIKDGIHAIILVLSVRTRFTEEQETVLSTLQSLFGSKIVDYMIVVFTGGDDLEENEENLEDYLGHECPKALEEILGLCENRVVLFDNKTKDEGKRSGQVQELLSFVNMVLSRNGGRPYTDELFTELKMRAMELHKEQRKADSLKEEYSKDAISEFEKKMQQTYDDQIKLLTEMVLLLETEKAHEEHRKQAEGRCAIP
ncbi:hypothetical protein V8G54_016483 [Vigna mungo]|uniref:AIG1-type G domain-containing protein n=1 Tax=Vigna mungo TaxID=3915 RepID=A0AAQ3NN14_VIGMU